MTHTETSPYFANTSEFLLTVKLLHTYAPEAETTERLSALTERVVSAAFSDPEYFTSRQSQEHADLLDASAVPVSEEDRALIGNAVLEKSVGPRDNSPEYNYAVHKLGRWVADKQAAEVAGMHYEPVNDRSGVLSFGNLSETVFQTP